MRECMSLFLLLLFSNIVRFESDISDRFLLETMGSQLAIVDELLIFADNIRRRLIIRPIGTRTWMEKKFDIGYRELLRKDDNLQNLNHVYSLVMSSKPVNKEFVVAMVGEDTENELHLLLLRVNKTTTKDNLDIWSDSILREIYREPISLAIDPSGEQICLIIIDETICYDTRSKKRTEYDNDDLWEPMHITIGLSMIFLEDQRAFVVAYRFDKWERVQRPYVYVANFSDPSQPVPIGMVPLSSEYPWESLIPQALDDPPMPISVHEDSKTMIIGMPFIDTVYILSFEDVLPKLIFTHISPEKNIEFGQSVAMLDGKSYAVLARSLPTLPWALSRIQVYSLAIGQADPELLFSFPNNQQELYWIEENRLPQRYNSIVLESGRMLGIVLNDSTTLILPENPPASFSTSGNFHYFSSPSFYQVQDCLMGTQRNSNSFGPCFICPPSMKSVSGLTCEPCRTMNTSTRCFLAAIEEIDMENLPSHNQAYPYPESSDSTEYDDLLLSNMFQLSTKSLHCLLLSPVFWAIVGCFICIILVKIFFYCLKRKMAPTFLLAFFARLHRISAGQIYARIFLVTCFSAFMIFLGVFSFSFAHRYPIERATLDHWRGTICDPNLVNSKFTSSLQLLSLQKHEEEQPIFALLDEQNLTLTVQLIGTSFLCKDLSIEQSQDYGLSLALTQYQCFENNTVLNLTIPLSQHLLTLQLHLPGPYFVGAIRLCLTGPPMISTDGKYTLQRLDHCELHSTPNHTLSRNPTVRVKLTKAINLTKGMGTEDDVTYSGIWFSSLTIPTLTDIRLLERHGEFFRYLSSNMRVVVEMTESEFYIKNVQEPISRAYEIIFKTVLFSMLCFDVLGLFVLILRWTARPWNLLIRGRKHRVRQQQEAVLSVVSMKKFDSSPV